jgi:hypothetical protein
LHAVSLGDDPITQTVGFLQVRGVEL